MYISVKDNSYFYYLIYLVVGRIGPILCSTNSFIVEQFSYQFY